MSPVARSQLLEWQAQHRHAELSRELRRLRWRRLRSLWVDLGIRMAAIVSPIVLGLLYGTVFLPFGVLGRLCRPSPGWLAPRRPLPRRRADLRSPA